MTQNVAGGDEPETNLMETPALSQERRNDANKFVDGRKIGRVLALWYHFIFSDVESYLLKCQGDGRAWACGER